MVSKARRMRKIFITTGLVNIFSPHLMFPVQICVYFFVDLSLVEKRRVLIHLFASEQSDPSSSPITSLIQQMCHMTCAQNIVKVFCRRQKRNIVLSISILLWTLNSSLPETCFHLLLQSDSRTAPNCFPINQGSSRFII